MVRGSEGESLLARVRGSLAGFEGLLRGDSRRGRSQAGTATSKGTEAERRTLYLEKGEAGVWSSHEKTSVRYICKGSLGLHWEGSSKPCSDI